MASYLLIHGQGAAQVVETLAIAGALVATYGAEETQVDIATTEPLVEYARQSGAVRRVVGVPPLAQAAWDDLKSAAGGGFAGGGGGLLSSMTSSVKKLAQAAGKNIKESKAFLEELRMVDYDMVFDFEGTAFSVGITKAANTRKIVGFDARHLINPVPGANLAYHENHYFSGALSHAQLMRKLIERTLDSGLVMPHPPCANAVELHAKPAGAPAEPFLYVSRELPTPFVEVIDKSGSTYCLANDGDSATARLAWVQHAAGVVGNEIETSLASFVGKDSLYIGLERLQPANSTFVSTPAELASALSKFSMGTAAALAMDNGALPSSPPSSVDDTPIKL